MMKELKDIPKDNPFKVPENYFEELEGRIMAATAGAEKVPVRKRRLMKLLPYLAVAASIAVLAIIGYSVLNIGNEGKMQNGFPEISINEFTQNYLNDIDIVTLEERVAESGLIPERTGVSSNDIIDYLVVENIDILDIYEHL